MVAAGHEPTKRHLDARARHRFGTGWDQDSARCAAFDHRPHRRPRGALRGAARRAEGAMADCSSTISPRATSRPSTSRSSRRARSAGFGFHEAPRGVLSHWMVIEDGKIKNYQCVVPSTWNAGPRDENDAARPLRGVAAGQSGRRSGTAAGGAAHRPLVRSVPRLRDPSRRHRSPADRVGEGVLMRAQLRSSFRSAFILPR